VPCANDRLRNNLSNGSKPGRSVDVQIQADWGLRSSAWVTGDLTVTTGGWEWRLGATLRG